MKRSLTNYGSQHSQTFFNLLSTPDKRHLYHDMVQDRMHRIIKLCTFGDLRRPINLTDLFRLTTHDPLLDPTLAAFSFAVPCFKVVLLRIFWTVDLFRSDMLRFIQHGCVHALKCSEWPCHPHLGHFAF